VPYGVLIVAVVIVKTIRPSDRKAAQQFEARVARLDG